MTKYLSNLLKRPFSGIIEQLSRMENRVNSIHAELYRLNRELQIAQHDVKTLAGLLARKQPDTIDTELRREIHSRALNVIGVLNWRDDIESGERHFVTKFLKWKPSAVILDVGANLGGYARMVREISADAVLHCFEPHPVSYQSLAAAAASLNITTHALALGEKAAEWEMFDYATEAGSQHASLYRDVIEVLHQRPATSTKVRCEGLDVMAEQLGLDHIGLLKIDTEGHELAVLKGAPRLLANGAIDVVQFEFNEMNVVSRVFMRDFFQLLPNYRFYRLLPDGVMQLPKYEPALMEIFAFQNLICVRNDLDATWINGT